MCLLPTITSSSPNGYKVKTLGKNNNKNKNSVSILYVNTLTGSQFSQVWLFYKYFKMYRPTHININILGLMEYIETEL